MQRAAHAVSSLCSDTPYTLPAACAARSVNVEAPSRLPAQIDDNRVANRNLIFRRNRIIFACDFPAKRRWWWGATGIGEGIAVALAAEGCRVLIAGRRMDKLQQVARARAAETPLLTHTVDAGDRADIVDCFAGQSKNWARSIFSFIRAGANVLHRDIANTTPEEWDHLMATNATGFFHCLQAVLPAMRERRDGLVINISSIAGNGRAAWGASPQAVSKFALTALGTFATLEEGQHGIRVTNIYPGEVETPILDKRPVAVTAEHRAESCNPKTSPPPL